MTAYPSLDREAIRRHVEMLHKLAAPLDGKLIVATYGEDPEEGKAIVSKHSLYDDPAAAETGSRAFRLLMDTPTATRGDVKAYKLTLLNQGEANAYSTAGGQIYVTSGMLPIIGNDVGLWAAVIAHETGHIVAHHQYKQYVRQFELKLTNEILRRQAATGRVPPARRSRGPADARASAAQSSGNPSTTGTPLLITAVEQVRPGGGDVENGHADPLIDVGLALHVVGEQRRAEQQNHERPEQQAHDETPHEM